MTSSVTKIGQPCARDPREFDTFTQQIATLQGREVSTLLAPASLPVTPMSQAAASDTSKRRALAEREFQTTATGLTLFNEDLLALIVSMTSANDFTNLMQANPRMHAHKYKAQIARNMMSHPAEYRFSFAGLIAYLKKAEGFPTKVDLSEYCLSFYDFPKVWTCIKDSKNIIELYLNIDGGTGGTDCSPSTFIESLPNLRAFYIKGRPNITETWHEGVTQLTRPIFFTHLPFIQSFLNRHLKLEHFEFEGLENPEVMSAILQHCKSQKHVKILTPAFLTDILNLDQSCIQHVKSMHLRYIQQDANKVSQVMARFPVLEDLEFDFELTFSPEVLKEKKWKKVTFKTSYLRQTPFHTFLMTFLQTQPSLEQFKTVDYSPNNDTLNALAKFCPHLSKLEFNSIRLMEDIEEKSWQALAQGCPNLDEVIMEEVFGAPAQRISLQKYRTQPSAGRGL